VRRLLNRDVFGSVAAGGTFTSAGMAFQMVAAHADLVANEFMAQLESLQPVGADGAVAQSRARATWYRR